MSELIKQQQQEVKKEVEKQVETEVEKEVKKRLSQKFFEKTTIVRNEFKQQTLTALLAAFGFVIALSWQSVIKKIVDNSIPKSGILLYHPYLTDLYTAIIITVVCVIGILLVSRWAKKPSPQIS